MSKSYMSTAALPAPISADRAAMITFIMISHVFFSIILFFKKSASRVLRHHAERSIINIWAF